MIIEKINKYFAKRYHIVIILLVFFQVIEARSQSINKELDNIQQTYDKLDNVQIKQIYNYYQNHVTNKILDSKDAVIKKEGELLYLKSIYVEKIVNNKMILEIDHSEKTVSIYKCFEDASASVFYFEFDSLINWSFKRKFTPLDDNLASLKFSFEDLQFKDVEIIYNRENYLIDKMILYYYFPVESVEGSKAQSPRLEIINLETKTSVDFDNDIFSEKKYITRSKGSFMPVKQFAEYTLFNNYDNITN